MIRTLFKTCLLLFCSVLLWSKSDNAMATCSLTSSSANVTLAQNYNFSENSNYAHIYGNLRASPFWSGQANETYTCPSSSSQIFFCGTDDQYVGGGASTALGPGIYAGGYASDGSTTTASYDGCFGIWSTSKYPASGNLPTPLITWKYAGARIVITDSTEARNITLTNKFIGTIFLTTSPYMGEKIGGGPLTRIYLTGTISVPASCTLSSSATIQLPDTFSGEYGKAGAGAKVGNGTSQPMSIKCLGGSESATIDLHVSTSKVSGDDIVTSNPDVGVRVLDGNGNTISANNGKTSATLSAGEVDVPLTYVPVAISGKNPTPGDYSAIETITVTIP